MSVSSRICGIQSLIRIRKVKVHLNPKVKGDRFFGH
uniref:Uncharacterized protein n=1 Tax=Arundo donax TaxID=35708 RepID=A0A0A9BNH5_ARUDO